MNTVIENNSGYVECWDDVSNAPLDIKLMRAARELEVEFFENIVVWAGKLSKATVKARGGTVIQGCWVDTSKGVRPLHITGLDSRGRNSTLALTPRSALQTPPHCKP